MVLDTPFSRSIIFGILLTMVVPSITCSVFILYSFARSPELLKRLNNHVILALLLISLIQVTTELPFTLFVLHTGFVAVQSDLFCRFWSVYNYALFVHGLMFMAYGCVERYFLVFYRVFFKKHLLLLHYGPLVFCLTYPLLLYFGLIVIYRCENVFNYRQLVCGGVCYQYEFALGLFDWFTNVCSPVVIGAFTTAALIARVFIQKRRIGQRGIWQRNRKMTIQLISVSMMYIIVWIPSVVCFVIPLITPCPFALELATGVLNYVQYLCCLLCPFMCLVGLPKIRNPVARIFTRQNNVKPLTQPPVAFIPNLPQH